MYQRFTSHRQFPTFERAPRLGLTTVGNKLTFIDSKKYHCTLDTVEYVQRNNDD